MEIYPRNVSLLLLYVSFTTCILHIKSETFKGLPVAIIRNKLSVTNNTTFRNELVNKENAFGNNVKEKKIYSNLFVLKAQSIHNVKLFAAESGFTFIRKVFKDEDYYLFRHSASCTVCSGDAQDLLKKISEHPSILWAAQQNLLHRVQRYQIPFHELPLTDDSNSKISLHKEMFQKSANTSSMIKFNDPLFAEQWYLHNKGQTGSPPENDINVLPVWKSGITGRGVRISVLDDGIYKQNVEVADNYDSKSSEDFLHMNSEHTSIAENSHGTYCAAIAAGVANNEVCGVGVAYDAKVGGVRILDGPVTDAQEAMALVHALDYVDIYTASWGPNDDGKSVASPGTLTSLAFLKGVTEGRRGKGALYVWAAGNGGRYLDNCNLDGYASSPFTLTIGALTAEGLSTYYSEPCAAVIASVYIGGSHIYPNANNMLVERRKIKVVVPEGRGKCRDTFQGTSAAAPMAAGVIALVLQANPDLSWRDVQHIIAGTSRIPSPQEAGWKVNAAGKHFHLKIGFGVLDAEKMVRAAAQWALVSPLHVWTSPANTRRRLILPKRNVLIPLLVQKSMMHPLQRVDSLESVSATINVIHQRCGDLEIFLRSPSKTWSQVLTRRPFDNVTTQFPFWEFVTLHFWGEDPEGFWLLRITNRGSSAKGIVNYFSLVLHGTVR